MTLNPDVFPENPSGKARFFINGPVGSLEVKTESPSQKSQEKGAVVPVTVIVSHPHPLFEGTMENKVVTTTFRAFHNMGARVVRFNYRGVGESQGEYGEAIGETDDLHAIIRWVEAVRSHDQIWLAGFSFGAYVSLRAASDNSLRNKVSQLITIAPPVHHFEFDELSPILCPWLVIQGDADEVVPPDEVFKWVDKLAEFDNPPKLIRVNDVGHFFHGRLLELREILKDEFEGIFSLK